MEIETATTLFVGPNLFSHGPVVVLTMKPDIAPGEPGPDLARRLSQALPSLGGTEGLAAIEGGGAAGLAQAVLLAAVELQRLAGAEVGPGEVRTGEADDTVEVVLEYEDGRVGLRAAEAASQLIGRLMGAGEEQSSSVDHTRALRSFLRFAQNRRPDVGSRLLRKEATRRGIPWLPLSEALILYGQGRYQRRTYKAFTDRTAYLGVQISSDKSACNRRLGQTGLPVPRQATARNKHQAVKAAEEIGYPVVVKPLSADFGRGISLRLADAIEVEAAFARARKHSSMVIVEQFIEGDDHRLLVIDGNLVAAAKRMPAHVIGDGTRTITELVEIANLDPRRGASKKDVLSHITLDDPAIEVLARGGYTPASVPKAGETVFARQVANLSAGGTAVDVTDRVHDDNRAIACAAAAIVGLDVAGVDLLIPDIGRSYLEVGGAICEVNCTPGLRMHHAPSEGKSRNVAAPIIDLLFPPGAPSRIPIAAITGSNGKTTTAYMLAHILKGAGRSVGLTTTEGLYLDGRRIKEGDMAGPGPARQVLHHPLVDAAVLETARGAIIKYGLGFDFCNVAAVLNVDADHLGFDGIETVEDLARVKRLLVEVARDTAVLNADDPLCLAMREHAAADEVCYVSMAADNPRVAEHLAGGSPAVTLAMVEGREAITFHAGGETTTVIESGRIPATFDGRVRHNVENALFAAAIAWSMGQPAEAIRDGLASFATGFEETPGRMNVYEGLPFTAIVDFAHNPAKIDAICRATDAFPAAGRRLCVITSPGNRRDEHFHEMGRLAAGHFDRYICTSWDELRGREPEEVPTLLRDGLLAGGVDADRIEIVPSEEAAIATGLAMAREGDLLLLLPKKNRRAWNQLVAFEETLAR
ncbi:MAG: cyanophycin synthetase [Alphaproteobacteria bacterium]|jgi:cyanophycin synthetase|nr:cyanophycin synthetase [Alphaproteobacteria bacterium]